MLFGSKFSNVLNGIGAGLKDVHGSGNVAAFQNQLSQMQQRQKQAQLVAQLQGAQQPFTPGVNGNQGVPTQGGGGGLSQQQLSALAQLNPQAFAAAQAKAHFAGPTVVAGGSSVFQNGQFRQAPQNFQNGSRVGTLGPNGLQSHDLGQNQAEANTAFANATTRQNNLATQGLEQNTLAETIRNNDLVNANTQFANQTGRLNAGVNQQNANTALFEAQNGGAANALNPLQQQTFDINAAKFEESQAQKASAAKDAEDARNGLISDLSRLREGGDLADGVGNAFGLRVPFGGSLSGSKTADVRATVNKITSTLTLDKIKNFKGAISDKDLEIAQSAATTLQNKNISNNEARAEIERLFTALGGDSQQSSTGGLTAAEQAELAELERQFGGQ